jgi:hypothetical protein
MNAISLQRDSFSHPPNLSTMIDFITEHVVPHEIVVGFLIPPERIFLIQSIIRLRLKNLVCFAAYLVHNIQVVFKVMTLDLCSALITQIQSGSPNS